MSNPIYLLWKVSEFELNAFLTGWSQAPQATPQAYSQSVTGPVVLQLAPTPPAVASMLELILVRAGATINLSGQTPVVLGVPDDFAWGIKWGALADLLSGDGQAKDPERAAYCESRYAEAVQLAKTFPAVLQVQLGGSPLSVGSVFDLDSFMPNWENASLGSPTVAGMAGRNLMALAPPPGTNNYGSLTADVVTTMKVPSADTDYLQVPADLIPIILDFAQHLASFKMGGAEFAVTMQQRQNMLNEAANYNERLRQLDFFNDAMRAPATTEQAERPRIQSPILTVSKGAV